MKVTLTDAFNRKREYIVHSFRMTRLLLIGIDENGKEGIFAERGEGIQELEVTP